MCYGVSRENIDLIHEIHRELLGQFRKPNYGMISASLKNFKNLSKALMVGDRSEDEEAAKNAGIHFLSADIWRFPPIDREF
ncbi:MAG: HAD hydrolase-like protein [Microcystis aeruginosa G11-09]|nr:HAD hydrolase-like protein [Microcystis aeruginosa G11-09]